MDTQNDTTASDAAIPSPEGLGLGASPVGLIPEIGQTWRRGEKFREIVDISETRVWLVVRKSFTDGEEYDFILREKWAECVEKTMAVEGTEFIPANTSDDRRIPPKGDA